MKLRMLGTGHGECKVKRFISKDYRKRGGVLIDDTILLDAPADIFDLAEELGLSRLFDKITDVFISHSHKGHFDPEAIERLARGRRIRVLADRAVLSLIGDIVGVEPIAAEPLLPIEIGRYKVLPLPTNHTTENAAERCLNYVISSDKTLLYMLDGGFISADAWRVISRLRLDAVIMDCAAELETPSEKYMRHGSASTAKMLREMLISSGAATPRTRFILSHIPSPKKRSVHAELEAEVSGSGLTVAYDGYFINI